ncbi:lactococcin 972 family bacteriocin [Paenibacillus amylolyticus]|uniref:lactococcin 972 family bacteriocin n=1 Tax=Paenibacillus amylolyticus TaxID=1451 RepID=UPI003396AD86
MKKKLLTMTLAAAVLLVPISQAMAQTNQTANSGSVDLTNIITEDLITTFATADNGGGTWDYGTSVVMESLITYKKKVWSNYNHATKIHSSTASIGTQISRSGQVNKGVTSYASAIGGLTDDTHAYWNVY